MSIRIKWQLEDTKMKKVFYQNQVTVTSINPDVWERACEVVKQQMIEARPRNEIKG